MEPLKAGDPARVGSYVLVGRLGGGGMGEVFLGRSPGGRQVAVKLIRPEHARNDQFRRRFRREIAAARRVGGFHTAQVVDADPDADPPWLVTDFIPGPSLRELVAERGPLPPDALRALAAGLAEGVLAVHGCGLVHRDLKPGNVIMAEDGPRVIDFGIAQDAEGTTMTATGTVLGTYAYMSPEQVDGRPAGRPSDVFSFGAVLVYAATGRGPFDAPALPALVDRILQQEPDLTGLPGDLRPLAAACLAKDPAVRPGIAACLNLLRPGAPPVPEPGPARRPGSRRIGRRQILIGSAAVAGLAGAGGLAAGLLGASAGGPAKPAGRAKATRPAGTASRDPSGALTLAGPTICDHLAFNRSGTVVAVLTSDSAVWLFDTTTGASTLTTRLPITKAEEQWNISPDLTRVAAAEDRTVRIWDVAAGHVTATLSGYPDRISQISFSPDGSLLAVACATEIRLTNVASGRTARTIRPGGAIDRLAFDPAGHVLAAGDQSGLNLVDVPTGRRRRSIAAPPTGFAAKVIAFGQNGRTLAAITFDDTLELIDAASGRTVASLAKDGFTNIDQVAFSPDGTRLAAASANLPGSNTPSVHLWDLTTRAVTTDLPNLTGPLAFSPDGKTLAAAIPVSITASGGGVKLLPLP